MTRTTKHKSVSFRTQRGIPETIIKMVPSMGKVPRTSQGFLASLEMTEFWE